MSKKCTPLWREAYFQVKMYGPSVASLCHPWFTTTNLSYRFPIFETSATALCGTTGTCIYIYLGLQNTWNLSGLPKYLVFQHFGDIKPGSLFKTPGFHDLPGQVLLRCRFKTLFGLIYPTHVLSEIDWTVFKWIDQGSCKVWTCNCASWRNVFFFHQSCKYEWNLPLHLDIACL